MNQARPDALTSFLWNLMAVFFGTLLAGLLLLLGLRYYIAYEAERFGEAVRTAVQKSGAPVRPVPPK
jgi:hypothetical protein